jgi:hypothetical protein
VKFTGVELTGNSGNPVTITFSQPKTIDLLKDSGLLARPAGAREALAQALCRVQRLRPTGLLRAR